MDSPLPLPFSYRNQIKSLSDNRTLPYLSYLPDLGRAHLPLDQDRPQQLLEPAKDNRYFRATVLVYRKESDFLEAKPPTRNQLLLRSNSDMHLVKHKIPNPTVSQYSKPNTMSVYRTHIT